MIKQKILTIKETNFEDNVSVPSRFVKEMQIKKLSLRKIKN